MKWGKLKGRCSSDRGADSGGKAVQQVLAADEAVPEAARLLGRANNNLPGVAGEPFWHCCLPSRWPRLRCAACSVNPSCTPSAYADYFAGVNIC